MDIARVGQLGVLCRVPLLCVLDRMTFVNVLPNRPKLLRLFSGFLKLIEQFYAFCSSAHPQFYSPCQLIEGRFLPTK